MTEELYQAHSGLDRSLPEAGCGREIEAPDVEEPNDRPRHTLGFRTPAEVLATAY